MYQALNLSLHVVLLLSCLSFLQSRCGSTSPRTETKDSSSSGSDGGGRDKVDLRVHKLIEALEGIVTMDQLNRDAVELLRLVPDGYIPLPHQVGGHRHIDGKVGEC